MQANGVACLGREATAKGQVEGFDRFGADGDELPRALMQPRLAAIASWRNELNGPIRCGTCIADPRSRLGR